MLHLLGTGSANSLILLGQQDADNKQCTSDELVLWTYNDLNKNSNKMWGIYNLSSSGETSWYKFASIIADKMGYNSKLKIIPINSKDYSAAAERPLNSRLDNSKIFNIFGIKLPNWEDSFHNFFKNNTKEFK